MTKGFMLIDGNNIGYSSNSIKSMSLGTQPVQAIYGFLRTLRSAKAMYNHLVPIVLWDGKSWRREIYPEYKANRDKESVTKSDFKFQELRQQYAKQLSFIKEGVNLLGVRQYTGSNMEADDLAAIFADKLKGNNRVLLVSGDKDWIQLIDDNVIWLDPISGNRITVSNIEEKLNVKNGDAWLDVKCLMGDAGDNISGVGGIGEKGAIEFVNTYGSVDKFFEMVNLTKEINPDELPKKYRDFAIDENKLFKFRENKRLMSLKVNNLPKIESITNKKTDFNKEGFREFCKRFMFKSFLKDYDNWVEPFER